MACGHLFLFRGKRGDYLKALYWDGSGSSFSFAKSTGEGSFRMQPPIVDGAMTLTPAQLWRLADRGDGSLAQNDSTAASPAQPMLVNDKAAIRC